MTIAFTTITNSIAALSITGAQTINIRDIDEIPDAVEARDCPILFPDPTNFITNFTPVRKSFGGGTVAKFDIQYNMNYLFLQTAVGSGRGLFDVMDDMLDNIAAIFDAIIDNNLVTGLVDMTPSGIAEFGPVRDPAGNDFLGTNVIIQILEFKN